MDTSGFYKNEDDSGMIFHGHNYVISGSYNLYRDQKDTYTYPVSGWYWFDSTEDAYAFWNIPMPQINPHYPLPDPPQEQES